MLHGPHTSARLVVLETRIVKLLHIIQLKIIASADLFDRALVLPFYPRLVFIVLLGAPSSGRRVDAAIVAAIVVTGIAAPTLLHVTY